MPVMDALGYIHGTGSSGQGPITNLGLATMGDTIFQTASGFTNLELDFGAPSAGTSYPYLPEFPSLNEKGYTNPPEVVGQGGVTFGIHMVIGQAVAGGSLTSGTVNVCSSAASGASAVIASRNFTSGQLGVSGAHYFIPVNGVAVLEFLRAQLVANGGAAGSGTGVLWYGPATGGDQ